MALTPEQRVESEARWSTWMAEAQCGNKDSYRSLLGELYPFLKSFCLKRCNDEDLSEDVAQNSLVAIHEARHTYLPSLPFINWALVITRHKLIDEYRKVARTRKLPQILENSVTFPLVQPYFSQDPSESRNRPDVQIEMQERKQILDRALSSLSKSFREAIQLVKIEELSILEAAEKLKQSPAVIKIRVFRAMQLLQKLSGGTRARS